MSQFRSPKTEGSGLTHAVCYSTRPRLCLLFLLLALSACSPKTRKPSAPVPTIQVPDCYILYSDAIPEDPGLKAYKEVLDAVALNPQVEPVSLIAEIAGDDRPRLLILPKRASRSLSPRQVEQLLRLMDQGAVLVSEGISPLAERLGFRAGSTIPVKRLMETSFPEVDIRWRDEEHVTPLRPPEKATVLSRERASGGAMACSLHYGKGCFLLLATELASKGGEAYARFPYLLQEIQQAGVNFPIRSDRLSALFDYSYRLEDDPETLVTYWRQCGIGAVHVGAWDFYDGDRDAEHYLTRLIEACHRNGILVYAWLELPHVSLRFWEQHPEWREKTATGRDAHVDWRYAMNLSHPECFQAVAQGLERLCRRFEWDGVNLAELYFDTPVGKTDPDNFTPLNSVTRNDFKRQAGFDPVGLFQRESPNHWSRNPAGWKSFVEYRVRLERSLNERFIRLLQSFRNARDGKLALVVTYVDNLYDPTMREAIGADVKEMLGLLEKYDFTLVMEDPGTVWHLGPGRYAELGQAYSSLTRRMDRLGIDINIVDRITETYPTQKQTGIEFVELFSQAGRFFKTVMVYSEKTMYPHDARLIPYALAAGSISITRNGGVQTRSPMSIILRSGLNHEQFIVDGRRWPCVNHGDVLLPAGSHHVAVDNTRSAWKPRLVKLNGELLEARYAGDSGIEFTYNAAGPALAIFSTRPQSVRIDNAEEHRAADEWVLLPQGTHKVLALFQ